MLKQLADLTLEADARYATADQLQFLKNYLDSVDDRVEAYKKMRDAADSIIEQVKLEKQKINPDFEWYNICKRDIVDLLRYSAAAMLFDDLERLRNGMLVWYKTIVRAYNYEQDSDESYRILQDVIKIYLSPEEVDFVMGALQLNHAVLAY
jgi:hypothetical protein